MKRKLFAASLGVFMLLLAACNDPSYMGSPQKSPSPTPDGMTPLPPVSESVEPTVSEEPCSEGLEYHLDGESYILSGIGSCNDEDLVIPSFYNGKPVTAISKYAFRGCTELKSVNIPGTVKDIKDYAFYGCTGLTSVTLGDGVKTIWHEAFYGCTGLTDMVIPDSITSIEYNAFAQCTGLASIELGKGLNSIWEDAFQGCTGLTSVVIPENVKLIASGVFADCTALVNVSIPEGDQSIGSMAFKNCSGLTSVIIPESVLSAGSDVFEGCTDLADIWCASTSKPKGWEAEWLGDCTATVHWGDSWEYVDGVPMLK